MKILITLPDRQAGIWSEEFMSEDLGEEYVVGLVLRFEALAADGGVGAAEWPEFVQRAEGAGTDLGS
jgi:hypothetical protein